MLTKREIHHASGASRNRVAPLKHGRFSVTNYIESRALDLFIRQVQILVIDLEDIA